MDRIIVAASQVPLETDILKTNRYAHEGIGWGLQAVLGTTTYVTDVTCIPTTPASMAVLITPGAITSQQPLDQSAYSSLGADTTHNIVKQGLLRDNLSLSIPAPTTVGFSQNYLIQAILSEVDANSVTRPYYNPSAPATAWSGPGGLGSQDFQDRQNKMVVTAKAGVAATTGTQTTPSPDAGYVGLFVVTVANGQSTISSGNIAQLATAPLQPTNGKLPQIPTGVQNGSWVYAADTGSVNALAVALVPAATSYVTGMEVTTKVANTTTSTTPTINVNGLGAKTITRVGGAALLAGDLVSSGMYRLKYDGTNFQVISALPSALQTGTSTTKAPKLVGISASKTSQVIPSAAGTYVTFDTVIQDNTSGATSTWNASTGTLTVGTGEAGLWFINWLTGYNATQNTGASYISAFIMQNGTSVLSNDSPAGSAAGNAHTVVIGGIVKLAAGDTIRVQAYQQSGASVTLTTPQFQAFLISAY